MSNHTKCDCHFSLKNFEKLSYEYNRNEGTLRNYIYDDWSQSLKLLRKCNILERDMRRMNDNDLLNLLEYEIKKDNCLFHHHCNEMSLVSVNREDHGEVVQKVCRRSVKIYINYC